MSTDKSAAAIREFAKIIYHTMNPVLRGDKKMEVDYIISDLTALISEHYYPKEFTEWVSGTGWQYHMKFKIWTLGMTKATTDEIYEVWKENER